MVKLINSFEKTRLQLMTTVRKYAGMIVVNNLLKPVYDKLYKKIQRDKHC